VSFEPSLVAADTSLQEPDRCERIAEVVKNIEMPETKRRFLSPALQTLQGVDPSGEQVLRTLLHVGTTWRAHVQKVQRLQNLSRLLARRSIGEVFPPDVESVLAPWAQADLAAYRASLARAVETGVFPDPQTISVLPAEAVCLRQRSSHLADTADPYDMKGMARLLPLLRIHDELADRLDILHRESQEGTSQEPDLGLLKFLGEKEFGRLEQVVKEIPGFAELPELWAVQRRLQLDPPVISALLTLGRTLKLPQPDASWLENILFWYRAADAHATWIIRFPVQPAVARLLARAGIAVDGNNLSFRTPDLVLPSLLDAHTASIDLAGGRKPPPPDWKGLVLSNITRDTLLTSFLANPKCVRIPGLVECVVNNCRSVQILSLIASKRDLHSGHQNKGVPAALLRSRSKLPMTLLRRFIHIRFVSKSDLKDLSLRAPRPEVLKEIADYLKTV
jgi:hypothetical protein